MTREEKQLIMDAVDAVRRLSKQAGEGRFQGHLAAAISAGAEVIRVRKRLNDLLESMCDDD